MKLILVTLFAVIAGPFFTWHASSDLVTGLRSKSWPKVEGTVTSSDLKMSSSSRGVKTYTPAVKYDYEVNGKSYTGERVDNGDRAAANMNDAVDILERYPEGKTVTVYHHPKTPEVAYLAVGATWGNWFGLVAGLAISAFGFFSARSLWRNFQSDNYA